MLESILNLMPSQRVWQQTNRVFVTATAHCMFLLTNNEKASGVTVMGNGDSMVNKQCYYKGPIRCLGRSVTSVPVSSVCILLCLFIVSAHVFGSIKMEIEGLV